MKYLGLVTALLISKHERKKIWKGMLQWGVLIILHLILKSEEKSEGSNITVD